MDFVLRHQCRVFTDADNDIGNGEEGDDNYRGEMYPTKAPMIDEDEKSGGGKGRGLEKRGRGGNRGGGLGAGRRGRLGGGSWMIVKEEEEDE